MNFQKFNLFLAHPVCFSDPSFNNVFFGKSKSTKFVENYTDLRELETYLPTKHRNLTNGQTAEFLQSLPNLLYRNREIPEGMPRLAKEPFSKSSGSIKHKLRV